MGIPFSAVLRSGAQQLTLHPTPDTRAPELAVQTGTALNAKGALLGQQIGVPESSDPPEPGNMALLPPQVQQVLQQSRVERQAQMQTRLQPPADLSALYVPRPLSLAANARLIDMLQAHALAAATGLTRAQITGYVALGERALQAIVQIRQHEGNEAVPMPARLPVEGGMFITANLEVMRAISWYVAACAAQQDANQQATGLQSRLDAQVITDLTVSGSYVFKDPHHAIYDFMNHYPAVYSRISTHFNDRSDSPLLAVGQPDQRGLEDYQNRLPGEGGSILFDRLKGGEIFFKFEHAGMPTMASAGLLDDQGQGGATAYQVAQRVGSHAFSFLWTLVYTSPGVERKEHVYKGLLEKEVHLPFLDLVRQAQKLGLLEAGSTPEQHAKQSKDQGLPHLEQALARLESRLAQGEQNPEWAQLRLSLAALQGRIAGARRVLGAQSDHLGIIRRGAETHADLNPPRAALLQAQQRFMRLEGDMANAAASAPTGIREDVALDWALHGITLGGRAWPGNAADWNAPGTQGRMSTLEQAWHALLQVCGGNAVAADWISRFARQAQAAPLLEYLRQESLGGVGSDVELLGGQGSFAITAAAEGVELGWNFVYQKVGLAPLQIRQGNALEAMDDEATLQASMRLRFAALDTFVAGQAPVPAIVQPLTYSLLNFNLAIDGWVEIEGADMAQLDRQD